MSELGRQSQLKSAIIGFLRKVTDYNYIFFALSLLPLVIALFMTMMESRVSQLSESIALAQEVHARLNDFNALQKQFSSQLQKFEKIALDISDPGKLSDSELRNLVKTELLVRVSEIGERLKRIEDFIVDKPERALATVTLRKDLDLLQKNVDERISVTRADTERVYSIIGWSLGAIFIAIITLLITNLFQRGKETEEAK